MIRSRMAVALALLAPLALGAWPQEGTSREVTLGASGTLRPGQSVAVTWDSLPPDTEEFEILLRCESPVAMKFRLTESEDPALSSFEWHIPAIATDRARLVIRFGRDGREATWARSRPFCIEVSPSTPVPRVALRFGEFWICDEPAPGILTARAAALWHGPGRSGEPCEVGRPLSDLQAAPGGPPVPARRLERNSRGAGPFSFSACRLPPAQLRI